MSAEAKTKTCTQCREDKELGSFSPASTGRDGRTSQCKKCRAEAQARRQSENPERRREIHRRYRRRNPEKVRERKRRERRERPEVQEAAYERHAERHPQRAAARRKVTKAVETGKLIKPSTCPRCGAEVIPAEMHAHHPDYSRPLDVDWMCRCCHNVEHGRDRGAALTPVPASTTGKEGGARG